MHVFDNTLDQSVTTSKCIDAMPVVMVVYLVAIPNNRVFNVSKLGRFENQFNLFDICKMANPNHSGSI